MVRSTRSMCSVLLCLLVAGAAQAALVTHVPDDVVPPVVVSPAFGALAPGGAVGTAAIAYGVDYSWGNVEGIFSDPPLAFGGVNGSGDIDLVSDVDGAIVALGTTAPALTSYIMVEAGFAAEGSLLLEVFDSGANLITSVANGPPTGPHGRQTMTIDRLGVYDIAYFRVSGNDDYGVNQVDIESPLGGGPVIPAPGAILLAGIGASLVAHLRRRRTL